MRENALPILEAEGECSTMPRLLNPSSEQDVTGVAPLPFHGGSSSAGVDLVLSGHIHTYERSVLLDGHYGPPTTYKPRCHAVNGGTGAVVSPYVKPLGISSHAGTVYVVVGSSGTVDQTGASIGAQLPEMAVRGWTIGAAGCCLLRLCVVNL
jgi:hypothetical protein